MLCGRTGEVNDVGIHGATDSHWSDTGAKGFAQAERHTRRNIPNTFQAGIVYRGAIEVK